MKTNEEKEIFENILGKDILSRKRERKGDFRNFIMDLHFQLQYNYNFSLYSKYEKSFSMVDPNFGKE